MSAWDDLHALVRDMGSGARRSLARQFWAVSREGSRPLDDLYRAFALVLLEAGDAEAELFAQLEDDPR